MSDLTPSPPPGFRAGYVTLCGRPNVGKSTLMNRLVGERLAIVTPRPQTTRQRIMAIWTDEGHQVIFLDTPGLLLPKVRLHQSMVRAARRAISEADVVLAIHDVTTPIRLFEHALDEAKRARGALVVALNKIDAVPKETLLPMIAAVAESLGDAETDIVPISAETGENVGQLFDIVRSKLPLSPPFYPPDVLTEHPERFFVAEIVREQILMRFRAEIPHAVQVEIERFHEAEGRKDEIDAVIHIEKPSQKGILIGEKGRSIKELGIAAREAVETFLDRPVVLKLFVKVSPKWRQSSKALRRMGFEP